MILKTCRLYNVFGSGANHGIYAQFMSQSALANGRRKVGLLRGAGTRMALWFYAMIRALRLRQPLTATIHQQKFVDLNLNESAKAAVRDIKDDKLWKCIYILLRAVFPALRLLRYCDKNKPAMDKIFFLSHRTTVALENSEQFLNDKSLFGSLKIDVNLTKEGNTILGGAEGADAHNSDDDNIIFQNTHPLSEDDSDVEPDEFDADTPTQLEVTPYNSIMSFGRQVIWHWSKRKVRIEHEYAIVGWALCVMEDIRNDVMERLTGAHRDTIEKVVSRLHVPPCPNSNPAVSAMSSHEIIDTFWNEFKAFQNRTNPYHDASRWASYDITIGNSHLWHEKYSLPYTKVLGFVACRVTSKLCGIGPAERSWGGVKQVKDGKRSHLSGESTEKRSILFVSSKIAQARIECEKMEKIDAAGGHQMFGDDDMNFDLELEKFGIDTGALKVRQVERVFRAWVEDWEEEARKKNDCVSEAQLLAKYKGLVFRDPDTQKLYYVCDQNMEFRRGKGQGWYLIGVWVDNPDPGDEDLEPYTLELACELIAEYPQKDGVQVLREELG